MEPSPAFLSRLWDLATVVLPIAVASSLAFIYGLIRLRREKQLAFIERQLREFYSPMVGCVKRIRARSRLRVEVSDAADRAWRKRVDRELKRGIDRRDEEPIDEYKKIIQYDARQLREELLPDYSRMERLFSENFWLANPATKQWYEELVKFVEIWNRWIQGTLPSEVLDELDHTEERLKSFYAHLDEELERLRSKLAQSKK